MSAGNWHTACNRRGQFHLVGGMNMTPDRRRLLQISLGMGTLGTLGLPKEWVRPVVNSVIVPAHAATSGTTTTTTLT